MGGTTQVVEELGSSVVDLGSRALTGMMSSDPLNPFPQGTPSGGGGGGIFGDISNAFTQITQPIEKAVTAGVEDTSKNLTTALQPVEKNVTQAVADTSKDLTSALQPVEKAVNYIGAHPELQATLILAVAVPASTLMSPSSEGGVRSGIVYSIRNSICPKVNKSVAFIADDWKSKPKLCDGSENH